jgi:hypothetical protein
MKPRPRETKTPRKLELSRCETCAPIMLMSNAFLHILCTDHSDSLTQPRVSIRRHFIK